MSIYGLQLAMKTGRVSVLSRVGSLSCTGQAGLAPWGQQPPSLTPSILCCLHDSNVRELKGNQREEAFKHERDALFFLVNDALLDDLFPKNA